MKKISVKYIVKPIQTKQISADSLDTLKNQIFNEFKVLPDKIKFIKPVLKDEAGFAKLKQGETISIMGPKQKELTEQQKKEKLKKEQQIIKMTEQLKLTRHEKILKGLKEKGIQIRGVQYINPDTQEPQDLNADFAIYPLYLLKQISKLRQYIKDYELQPKNPDGLIIEQLREIFRLINNDDGTVGIVDPLDWVAAFIAYCTQDIQYPCPVYDVNHFIFKLCNTIRSAYQIETQRKQDEVQMLQPRKQNSHEKLDPIAKILGIEVNATRKDDNQFQIDLLDTDKQAARKITKLFLQCDISDPQNQQCQSFTEGIKKMFATRKLWRNFYAFDIPYQQTINYIQTLPQQMIVHVNRFGYPPAVQQWQKVDLPQKPKSRHLVPFTPVLNLRKLCEPQLKDRLEEGQYERNSLFYQFETDPQYNPRFLREKGAHLKYFKNDKLYKKEDKCYMYFDHVLYKNKHYHEYYFGSKGYRYKAKPTGQFRLTGAVMHRGQYYHQYNPEHKHDCIGQMMVYLYQRDQHWLKVHKAEVTEVTINEVCNEQYWGEGEWTPLLLLYQQVSILNMQYKPNPGANQPINTSIMEENEQYDQQF